MSGTIVGRGMHQVLDTGYSRMNGKKRPLASLRTPIKQSRKLRERQTRAESMLWNALRAKRLSGLKFRRQHPIDPFIADFACSSTRHIIEIDGGYHDFQCEDDASRQEFLESLGWTVIRFSNEDVLADVDSVARSIAHQIGVELKIGKRKSNRSGMFVEHRENEGSQG